MNNLKGLGVALVTPFNEDLSIDFESLTKLIEYNIDNGTNFLVVLGTTAETATLSEEEKKTNYSACCKNKQSKITFSFRNWRK